MEESKIDIVAVTDKWFVMPTGVMMYSVCVNNPNVDIVFHILTDDSVTSKDRQDIKDVVVPFNRKSVVFYSVKEEITKFHFPPLDENSSITFTTYYRLWFTELLPKSIDKILYLDGDVIVRHSLLPLWNTDLNNYPIAAVPVDTLKVTDDFYSRLNESPQLGYFNAGVLLVNLKCWRESQVVKDFVGYMQDHFEDILYADQDILNYVFMKKKVNLPIKYNMQSGFFLKQPLFDVEKYEKEVQSSLRDPVIIHFTATKPWYYNDRNPHPYKSSFMKYQNQTKWKGVRYEQRPFKLQVINFVAGLLRKWKLKRKLESCFIDIDPID